MVKLFDYDINQQCLFDVLLSFPIQDGFLDWGHDYEGLLRRRYEYNSLLPGEERTLAEIDYDNIPQSAQGDPIYTFDPLTIPQLLEANANSSNSIGHPEPLQSLAATIHPDTDPFAKLPTEIMQMIFNTMLSRDVLNLRIASSVTAAMALTESFWASRFLPGFEFEDIFEAHQLAPNQHHWKKMYFGIKLLKDNPNIRNRRRISRLILPLRTLLTQYSFDKCSGDAVQSFFEPNATPSANRTWITSARAVVDPQWFFNSGCRALRYRQIPLPNTISAVFVSFIEFDSMRYISGLRFESKAGGNVHLGYIQSKHEFRLTLSTGEGVELAEHQIFAYRITMDLRGLKGISIITTYGASRWCGAHEGIPKTEVCERLNLF